MIREAMVERKRASSNRWQIVTGVLSKVGGCHLSRMRLVLMFGVLVGITSLVIPTLATAVPTVVEDWVADVSTTSVRLWARISPDELPTTYRFEYGTSESTFVPLSEGKVNSEEDDVVVEAHPQNLQPDTLYHVRVVVKNSSGEAGEGNAQFTTQPAGGEFRLPDGREWELVSPATKDGALILPIQEGGGLVQASESGGAVTYLSSGPVKSGQEAPPGNANDTQLLSIRGTQGGWSS